MKILIVTNHQPDIPPFMISNIEYAKTIFDQIYYVNTRYPSNAEAISGSTIVFKNPNKTRRLFNCCLIPFCFLRKEVFVQLFNFVRNKGIDFHYLRQMIYYLGADLCLKPYVDTIVQKNRNDQITILSTWFGACAYTVARIKKKYPFIKAVSLAHSFEILVTRNKYVPYFFVEYKHKFLDAVCFISETVRNLYIEGIGSLREDYFQKTYVKYLGCFKKDRDVLNKRVPQQLHICTCSRVIPLKRLNLLIEAMGKWEVCKIKWTHIGSGELFEDLLKQAEEVNVKNVNVEIQFIGRRSNEEVKEFYEKEPIDLFLNVSSIEGVPISIMEAISYGIPVMATDVGGTREIVNKQTGFLLPADINADDIITALNGYYDLDENSIQRLRHSSFHYWLNNFNGEDNIKTLFSLIIN